MDMLPIDTAPKDGTVILIYADDGTQAEFGQKYAVAKYFGEWLGFDGKMRYLFEYAHQKDSGSDYVRHRVVDGKYWSPLPIPSEDK